MNPLTAVLATLVLSLSALTASDLRIGMIGLDTSHVTAFASLLNDPTHRDHVPGGRVTAAFRGGSPDVDASRTRVDQFTSELVQKYGVRLYDSIEELCRHVDVVMLESVDGRPHLAQAIPVILAGKPLFIDKPMAGSLRDVLAIFRLAERQGVPVFSSSSLRYAPDTQAVRSGAIGRVQRAETSSPCGLEPHHPDLFWYGVHGVESLFTVMGRGCVSVTRGTSAEGGIEVRGEWLGGRVGIFREAKGYGGQAEGEGGAHSAGGSVGYAPLLVEVMKFFRTGVAPVTPEETIELFAFMEAADESKRRGGEAVKLAEVLRTYGYVLTPPARLVDVRKIWDAAPHNAFTDLARFRGEWFCVFREGAGHVSPDGAVRVLRSGDGAAWETAALLTSPIADLRDPKVSVTPDGRMMLVAAGALRPSASPKHQTYVWFSADGVDWGEPEAVGEADIWLWRVEWQKGKAYGVGYHTAGGDFTRLYGSEDGRRFDPLVPKLFPGAEANEAGLRFRADGTAVCLLRRDGTPGTAQLGVASVPYDRWDWVDLGVKIGGPNLIELPGGPMVAAVRLYDGGARTALAWVDLSSGRLREFLKLPSGGDTSYPGLVWSDGQLWVSYYSSHEGKSSIYLARVQFD